MRESERRHQLAHDSLLKVVEYQTAKILGMADNLSKLKESRKRSQAFEAVIMGLATGQEDLAAKFPLSSVEEIMVLVKEIEDPGKRIALIKHFGKDPVGVHERSAKLAKFFSEGVIGLLSARTSEGTTQIVECLKGNT